MKYYVVIWVVGKQFWRPGGFILLHTHFTTIHLLLFSSPIQTRKL